MKIVTFTDDYFISLLTGYAPLTEERANVLNYIMKTYEVRLAGFVYILMILKNIATTHTPISINKVMGIEPDRLSIMKTGVIAHVNTWVDINIDYLIYVGLVDDIEHILKTGQCSVIDQGLYRSICYLVTEVVSVLKNACGEVNIDDVMVECYVFMKNGVLVFAITKATTLDDRLDF